MMNHSSARILLPPRGMLTATRAFPLPKPAQQAATIRRRRTHFHLSTALVGMIAVGCCVWANFQPEYSYDLGQNSFGPGCVVRTHHFGWPSVAFEGEEDTFVPGHSVLQENLETDGPNDFIVETDNGQIASARLPEPTVDFDYSTWHFSGALANFLVMAGIVLLASTLAEKYARRQEA